MARFSSICWLLTGLAVHAIAAPVAEVKLNSANAFTGKMADGNVCRLAAIGRPSSRGFIFWDVSGARVPTPSGYTRPKAQLAGIDTVLVIEENDKVSRNFLTSQENVLLPVDATGATIEFARGAGTILGTPESEVARDRTVVAHHYVVPFSVIRQDGTSNFEFRATTSQTETIEELTPNSGYSRNVGRYEVITKIVRKETQMEIRVQKSPSPDARILAISARVRDDNGKTRNVKPTGISDQGRTFSTYFTLTKGTIEKLLVVRPVVSRLLISGVPMAPEGMVATPTKLGTITLAPAPRAPAFGEAATIYTGWKGRTSIGAKYELVGISDQDGAWNPFGIPIWQPLTVHTDPKTSIRIACELADLGPIQVISSVTKEVLPIELTRVARATSEHWTECLFDVAFTNPIEEPVTLRFQVPGKNGPEIAEIREISLKRVVSNRPL